MKSEFKDRLNDVIKALNRAIPALLDEHKTVIADEMYIDLLKYQALLGVNGEQRTDNGDQTASA